MIDKDQLVGLDQLRSEIEFAFCNSEKELIFHLYDNIIRSIESCKDLSTAQKNLDFGIKLLHLYADLRYLTAHIAAGTDFIEMRSKVFSDKFLEGIAFK